MSEALDLNTDLKTHDQGARVVLDKDIKLPFPCRLDDVFFEK